MKNYRAPKIGPELAIMWYFPLIETLKKESLSKSQSIIGLDGSRAAGS